MFVFVTAAFFLLLFYPFVSSKSCICMLFSSEPALLMGCHPGLSQKAASSVGLGINPGIMALMPSWVEAKLFKKYWLPESLSLLFLSPPLSIFCLYLFKLCSPFSALFVCHFLPFLVLSTVHTSLRFKVDLFQVPWLQIRKITPSRLYCFPNY